MENIFTSSVVGYLSPLDAGVTSGFSWLARPVSTSLWTLMPISDDLSHVIGQSVAIVHISLTSLYSALLYARRIVGRLLSDVIVGLVIARWMIVNGSWEFEQLVRFTSLYSIIA